MPTYSSVPSDSDKEMDKLHMRKKRRVCSTLSSDSEEGNEGIEVKGYDFDSTMLSFNQI